MKKNINSFLAQPSMKTVKSLLLIYLLDYRKHQAFALRKVLKEKGRLLLSILSCGPLVDNNYRDETGRLFNNYTPDSINNF